MRELATPRLRYAIITSLLMHLLLFWPDNARLLTKNTPSLLQASLRVPPQTPRVSSVPPAPSAGDTASGSAGGITPVPRVPKVLAPSHSLLERAEPPLVPQTPAASAEPAAMPAPAPAPAAVTNLAPVAPAGSTSDVLLTETSAGGESADNLRAYRMAIAIQARRFKRYPAQAMASGWQGNAEIRVEVGSDGRPRAASVVRSSGHEPLDRAALTMIDAGALRARLPDGLRGKAFAVTLPVMFNLDDE